MGRKFILERQRAGIDAAKAKGGVYEGRKPSVPVEEVRRLRGEGKGPAEIAEAPGVSRMSVWRALNAGACWNSWRRTEGRARKKEDAAVPNYSAGVSTRRYLFCQKPSNARQRVMLCFLL